MERRRGKHYTMMRYTGLSSNMGVCCPVVALVDTDLETTVGLLLISNSKTGARVVCICSIQCRCVAKHYFVILSAAL